MRIKTRTLTKETVHVAQEASHGHSELCAIVPDARYNTTQGAILLDDLSGRGGRCKPRAARHDRWVSPLCGRFGDGALSLIIRKL